MEEEHYLIPGELKIIQDNRYFKFGTDSVLLANYSNIDEGDRVIDFGSGSGVIPLLLAYKRNPARITGIEIQGDLVELARRNAALNNLDDVIEIIRGDFTDVTRFIEPGTVDHVITNPPFMPVKEGKITRNRKKAIARHEIHAELEDVIREAGKVLRFGGYLNIVHRTWRLAELMVLLVKFNLEPKKIRPVQARENRSPDSFLLIAKKGAGRGLKMDPPLIVYEGESDRYSEEVREIYGVDNDGG